MEKYSSSEGKQSSKASVVSANALEEISSELRKIQEPLQGKVTKRRRGRKLHHPRKRKNKAEIVDSVREIDISEGKDNCQVASGNCKTDETGKSRTDETGKNRTDETDKSVKNRNDKTNKYRAEQRVKCEIEETVKNRTDETAKYSTGDTNINSASVIVKHEPDEIVKCRSDELGNRTDGEVDKESVSENGNEQQDGSKVFEDHRDGGLANKAQETDADKDEKDETNEIHDTIAEHHDYSKKKDQERTVYLCEYENCHKIFNFHSNLKQHINAVHLNLRKYECKICQFKFKAPQALKAHCNSQHTRHEMPVFCCDVCKKRFSRKAGLDSHRSIHSDVKNYVCRHDGCNKAFRLKSNLVKHEKVHTNIKPHKCEICQESFSRKTYLDSHMYKHTGSKPFMCEHCSKTFSQKGNLMVHISNHAKQLTIHTCPQCNATFNYKSNFTKHLLSFNHDRPVTKKKFVVNGGKNGVVD